MNQPGFDRVSIDRLPRIAWVVAIVLGLGVMYLILQIAFGATSLSPGARGTRFAAVLLLLVAVGVTCAVYHPLRRRLRRRPDSAGGSTALGMPEVLEQRYRIEHAMGQGGMGVVYRARDLRLERDVAIKVVRADLVGDPDARRRFRREAQAAAQLQHPAIVSIFDYGTFQDGGAYLVMELVGGEDLRRILTREGPLSAARAARILSAVCGAIDAAHRAGILHRDLKPENVLIAGSEDEVKVVDFGVAGLLAASDAAGDDERRAESKPKPATMLTVEGTVAGTPAYMAPEQLRGEPLDARSDVFSLGVIAFEMLTGELPFGRGSLADIVLRQARGMPPLRGRGTRDGITPALEMAVQSALQLDPALRPVSPSAFAGLVQSAVGLAR